MAGKSDLQVDRSLIDPNFSGYKLSLDPLPIYKSPLHNGLATASLTADQYSYHHAKLFGVHNHLFLDPWCPSSVYVVDGEWNVVMATAHEMSLDFGTQVMTLPDAVNQQLVPGRCNCCLKFVSTDLAVITDGAGHLHIVDTGNRSAATQKWKILLTTTVPEDNAPCMLVDAVELSKDENHKMECCVAQVTESTPEEKEKYRSQFLTVLDWVTFTSVDRKSWVQGRNRKLVSRQPYHYAAFDREEPALVIASEADVIFTSDSEIPVVEEEQEKKSSGVRPPAYTWCQTEEDVTVQFTVPEDVKKADMYLTLKPNHVDFGIKNSDALLKGPLLGRVDVEGSTWTIDEHRVDLVLSKSEESMWHLVVEGDTRGEMVIDPGEAARIHERLAHLTSEHWNPDPNADDNKPYNSQQLEECDDFPGDDFCLMRLDGNSHKYTHRSSLGSNQWLFNADLGPGKLPALCLRHDVDGLLWQPQQTPTESEPAWTHAATFNAFGFVQASKQSRRFSCCPPNYSYAVICDDTRHIYVYRQSTPVTTPLRNRKTGLQVNAVAKQQVVSLETTDAVLGFQATNDMLFVVTEKHIFVINVKL